MAQAKHADRVRHVSICSPLLTQSVTDGWFLVSRRLVSDGNIALVAHV